MCSSSKSFDIWLIPQTLAYGTCRGIVTADVLEVDFLLTKSPAQSESEYPTRSNCAPLGYHKPKVGV